MSMLTARTEEGIIAEMTLADPAEVEARLKPVVFRLEWVEDGVEYQGTGFFISSAGLALTTFHNMPLEVRKDPRRLVRGVWREAGVHFRWALTSDPDIRWQEELDIAVLQLETKAIEKVPMADMVYVDLKWDRQKRTRFWTGRPVAGFGFPVDRIDNGRFVLGTIRTDPIEDLRVGPGWVENGGSIALADDFHSSGGEAPGLSGSPLYSRELNAVCGIVFAAHTRNGRLYATEFRHLAVHWPEFRNLARCKRGTRQWRQIVLALMALVVISVLLIWPPWVRQEQPSVEIPPGQIPVLVYRYAAPKPPTEGAKVFVHGPNWQKVGPGTGFRKGELVRFSVGSPSDGYLYVLDRERYADGTLGEPVTVFPTPTMKLSNRVSKGQTLEFPASTDDPPYVRLHASRADQIGEVLTFLIMANPIPSDRITASQLEAWSGPAPLPPSANSKVFVHPAGGEARAAVTIPVGIVR